MAKNSVCPACGMMLEGEKKFCPTCGSAMMINEIPDDASNVNPQNMDMPSSAPTEPTMDVGSGIPPVPPADNTFNGNTTDAFGNNIPPMGNTYSSSSPYGTNMGMNMGMNMNNMMPQKDSKDTLALAGMIVGIISIVLMCLYGFGALTGIAGLLLSLFGIKSIHRKAMAVAGTICSAIAIIGGIIVFIFCMVVIKESFGIAEEMIANGDMDAFIDEYEDIYDDYDYEYKYDWD